ncbi:MAG: hypothetical protein NZ949_03665 [Candidatus Kapabacteria bacterium]|nr:hypothetical protein [Candidatus Kapabacteria bacterium]MDW7996890.1 hypothetical protein [Bacteroidota bacterium]MDW8225936.1 hypothetical protein [Bacteroidota bacterium]
MRRLCVVIVILYAVVADLRAQQKDEEENGVVFEQRLLLGRLLEAPSINFYIGMGRVGREGLQRDVREPGVLILQLGSADMQMLRRSPAIVEYERDYVYVSVGASSLGLRERAGALSQQWWRFGIGKESGYGYRLTEKSSLLLTSGAGLQWTYTSLRDSVPEFLAPFHDKVRFGTLRDGTLILQFSPVMGAGISFERAVVFPAHLFWKHLGSLLMESTGHWLLGQFVKRVLRARTPSAAPVVNFLLHNAFAVGWYELLRVRMNWPFASAAPMQTDALRFHLQWIF